VIVICGPTASGKSSLALRLAGEKPSVIINADSLQLYADLPILTARPTREDEARCPHRLFGILGPTDTCSAARWRDLAIAEIGRAGEAGLQPILVGGTGFYLSALMVGMSPVPDVPEEVRERLLRQYAGFSGAALHDELAARDPAMAARLVRGDRQRCLRALEVLEYTGQSLAVFQDMPRSAPPCGMTFAVMIAEPKRAELYAACDRRFDAMLTHGAAEEVKALMDAGIAEDAPVFRALGAKYIRAALAGRMSMGDAAKAAKTETRHYAKRQATWFRHQLHEGGAVINILKIPEPPAEAGFSAIKNHLASLASMA